MAKPFGVWGIDIGQCAVKALRLEILDGTPTATAFDYIEHQKILSQPDADPEALIRESLEKFLDRNPIGNDHVATAIPGQSGLVRFVKLPPVEEKKVPDIVKFEAKQQIPFPLDEVVWDYQKIGGGDTVGNFAMETEIGLFAMKREIISKHLGYYQGTRTEVHNVQMTPLALVNYATYELLKKGGPGEVEGDALASEGGEEIPRGKKRCVVVLDVGTDSSNLIITDGGKIIWQRTVNVGGSHFTKALTKEMKLTFAKAEHLKRNAAKSPELAQILKALRPVLTEFVQEVQRSLGFFTNTHRDAHISYLVGLGNAFKLPGLQKYLAEKLSLDVRKPGRVERVAGDTVLNDPVFTENVLTFPVAYGLALQGLNLSRLRTNLLPNEVRVDRLIRAKKPAVAAACAALLMGTGLLSVGYGQQLRAVTDAQIDKGIAEGKSAVDAAKKQDAAFTAAKSEIEAGKTAVQQIVVGNDERLNWVRVQEVVAKCLPRPGYFDPKTAQDINNTNLTDVVPGIAGRRPSYDQKDFWRPEPAQRAVEKFRSRLKQGIPLDKLAADASTDGAENLAVVNLESIYCRYVDAAGTFLTAADAAALLADGVHIGNAMLESESEPDAAAPGFFKPKFTDAEAGRWVFELRGYTYHREGRAFVERGLARNLQRYKELAPLAPEKITEIVAGGVDPIAPEGEGDAKKERLSHVFVLRVATDPDPQPSQFRVIGQSLIDPLIGGGSAGGSGGPGGKFGGGYPGGPGGPPPGAGGPPGEGGAPGGAAAAAGPAWSPLTGVGGGASAGGLGGSSGGKFGGGPGGMSMGGGSSGGEGMGGPGGRPSGVGGPPTNPAAPKTGKKTQPRYEFSVCFLWREPTPTDPTPAAATPVAQ